MVVRPYWKGHLKLALVSCPIALHAACLTVERIAFRQVNKANGNRLREQLIDEETREPRRLKLCWRNNKSSLTRHGPPDMNAPVSTLARCAIYTRKSTEYNLELAFNSLDAQREACEAYIKS